MKLIYDDLLDEYLDENGNIVKGQPIAERSSYGQYFEVKEILGGTDKNENN